MLGGVLSGAFGGSAPQQTGPSQAELMAQQNASAQAERDKIARENEAKKLATEQKAVADLQAQESQRRAFAGQLAGEEDEEQRRKFLKGA